MMAADRDQLLGTTMLGLQALVAWICDRSKEARAVRFRPRRYAADARELSLGLSLARRSAIVASAIAGTIAASACAPAEADPVLAAAGDIACTPGAPASSAQCDQGATAAEIAQARPSLVAALGDEQYEQGALSEFLGPGGFGQTWGSFKSRIRPVPGNHEYVSSPTAAGYFEYFGHLAGQAGRGYYSFGLGAWHVVALNSSCSDAGCLDSEFGATTTTQLEWLKADLRRVKGRCILAYWHHPLFSSVPELDRETGVRPLWEALAAAHADVVLNGHAHNYERFARQSPSGRPSSRGLREFVVGTGGRSHIPFGRPLRTSQFRDSHDFGVLFLTLHPAGYDWQFRAPDRTVLDRGSTRCHYATAAHRRSRHRDRR
jgi:acid phosphatase type 7